MENVSTIEIPAPVASGVELRPDDVLMTEGGDLDKLGRGHLWNGQIDGCLHQNHIFAIRCFPNKLFPAFLTYLTASNYARAYFDSTGKRTTNLACTNGTKVGAFRITLPPFNEQQRIAAFLDASCAAIDAAVAAKRSQLETLDALRKTIIKRAVMQGIRPLPKMKPTHVEWIPEMPAHRRLVRLKDAMESHNAVRVPLSAAERGRRTCCSQAS